MKNEITTPDYFPDKDEEEIKREADLKAAAKRRQEYASVRDEQATKSNEAIARRLDKEKNSESADKP